MTNRELLEYNKNREICQICICVKENIEKVLDEWVNRLKVGPWTVITLTNKNVQRATMNGVPITEPFKYYCALAMYGNVQIEITQPVYGPFVGEGFLERTGGGLQHFKEKISDEVMGEKIKELNEAGLKTTFEGHIAADWFCNFESESSLGFSLEIGNFADIELPKDMYYIYPREDETERRTKQ